MGTPLKVTAFGGIMPSVHPRTLPAGAAQTAQNLMPQSDEFRPLQADSTVATVGTSNPATLYRFSRLSDGSLDNSDYTSNWVVNAAALNYAKGQIDDDLTDRTYVTYADGSQAPRAIDVTGENRLLGVPAPTAAPTVTLNVVDEFTPDERATGYAAQIEAAVQAVRNRSTITWGGYASPGTGTSGLIERTLMTPSTPDDALVLRVFRLSSTGGANNGSLTETYSANMPTTATWLFDPALGGFYATATGSHPSWTGQTNDHLCIPLQVHAKVISVDTGNLESDLAALTMPGTDDGTKLLTSEQAAELTTRVSDHFSTDSDRIKPKLDALKAKAADVIRMLNGDGVNNASTAVGSFYDDVAGPEITNAIEAFAQAVWVKAYNIANARDYA